MEKRRRERINSSLEELKTLVLEALNRDVSTLSSESEIKLRTQDTRAKNVLFVVT